MSYYPLLTILGLFGPLYVLGIPFILGNYICVTIQRCHDIGLSGWWSIALGLPGPNLALLAIPGNSGVNRYGQPLSPVRSERLIAPVMVLLTIASCGLYYLYGFRPAFQAYETRNAIMTAGWEKAAGDSPISRVEFTAPTKGVITLDSGEQIPMDYRARYRTLYLSFTLDGVGYAAEIRHNTDSNELEMLEDNAVTGTYRQGSHGT
jgi:hypothetical protein